MKAVLSSLQRHGHDTVENSLDADCAVIWSVLWSGRMAANRAVWQHYQGHNRPVIVVDIGALYRGETWKIALSNITAEGYYGHQENLDPDRPRKLGISLAVNLSRNPRIVIAAQHSRSLQVANIDSMESWISQQVAKLRQITDRPIVIRPHPRSRLDKNRLPKNIEIEVPVKIENSYDSYNLAFDCHAMVNHNSGPGIQAALAGTRPLVHETSLARPVGINFDDLEKPYNIDRHQWLIEICHTEYLIEEISAGSWLKRLNLHL